MRQPRKRSGLTYFNRALVHPVNVVLLTTVTAVCLVTMPWMVLVALPVLELLFLTIVPRSQVFREEVDLHLDAEEQRARQEEREKLLAQMNEDHRAECEHLELLLDSIRIRADQRDGARLLIDDHLGLERLLEIYIKLAIAYRSARNALTMTDRQKIETELRALRAQAAGGQLDDLRSRRMAIATRRLSCWERNLMHLRTLEDHLATIADLIRLIHERFVIGMDPEAIGEELDRFMGDFEECESILDELSGKRYGGRQTADSAGLH